MVGDAATAMSCEKEVAIYEFVSEQCEAETSTAAREGRRTFGSEAFGERELLLNDRRRYFR